LRERPDLAAVVELHDIAKLAMDSVHLEERPGIPFLEANAIARCGYSSCWSHAFLLAG
jgi:hypothetical protein